MASDLELPTDLEPTASLEVDDQGRRLLFTVTPPARPVGYDKIWVPTEEEANLPRRPVDFVIAIDVSGSTAAQAPVACQDPAASEDGTRLCILDVVKHAAESVCVAMRPQDRIAIVSFSGRANVDLPLTHMDARGKQKTLIALEQLQSQDRTNLWEGLKAALDLLPEPERPAGHPYMHIFPRLGVAPPGGAKTEKPELQTRRQASIFLFTDGMPDAELEPYRGIVVELETYMRSKKRDFTINTFGVGSVIHSSLLHEIASIAGGRFSFIADASKVGDVLAHTVANELAVFAHDLQIRLIVETGDGEILRGVEVAGWPGATELSYALLRGTNLQGKASFGPLEYGKSRSFILEFKKDVRHTSLAVSLFCRLRDGSQTSYPIRVSENMHPAQELLAHSTRLAFVNTITGLSDSRASGLARIKDPPSHLVDVVGSLKQEIQARSSGTSSPLDQALLADLDGKVSQLVSDSSAFRHWGLHHLLSLAQAHQLEQCGNSEDPGLRSYGESGYFNALKVEVTRAVETLGPPKASPRKSAIYGGMKGLKTFPEPARPPPPPQPTLTELFKAWYNPPPIVCFDGECHIDLADGSTSRVADLKVGAQVRTALGKSEVVGILKTAAENGILELCPVGPRLWITPWHPVKPDGEERWRFPVEIAQPQRRPCTAVYSLILAKNLNPEAHTVYVGGICCVTMGHGVNASANLDARAHPFFAEYEAVVEAVNAAPAQARTAGGVTQVMGLARDPVTGLVDGFRWVLERVEG
ncbi:hypothetical protein FRC04_008289 [Tulasnella sp. 424]|nr:hypothetical protein FRC04_008289 [Tulasnella sp. 424]KAG8970264.1 hypothetical protein FRC05_000638 [Tulasnella sp. 425]